MRILGIDPGTRFCGYGVIETDGYEARALEYGVVECRNSPVPVRLKEIFAGLMEVIERSEPDVAAVESTFSGRNAKTALRIGEGRGVALLAAANCEVEVVEYAPARVKKSVVGSGRAHKSQVQQMVSTLLHLPDEDIPEDAADALALALCHMARMGPLPEET
ncbi:MAG: crossover junction endodeoxyribonuclease RuvC [Candidatus Brocadiia bacterium]